MAAPSSHMWYVKAAGGVWGPYPEARIFDFVAEGRVSPTTSVSPWAAGPFQPAAANAEFKPWFEQTVRHEPPPGAAARAIAESSAATAVGSAAVTPGHLVAVGPLAMAPVARASPEHVAEPVVLADAGPAQPVLVWAQLSAASASNFLGILAAAGPGVTIRPGLWLVQARSNAATLRNLLSRGLSDTDAFLVIEATLDQVAWFNLAPAKDRELRRLWSTIGVP